MKRIRSDCPPLHKYFDYIAGTSIGGNIALAMVCGNASLEATIATVFQTAEDVLQYCPGCSSRIADPSAQAMFGRDLEVTDVQHPRVIITTALADQNPPALELICNYKPSGTRQ